jgi:hypothetical protein
MTGGDFMQPVVVNDQQAARFLGLGVQTLRSFRHLRKGPKYVKIGGRIIYRIADLEDFLNRNTIDPEGRAEGKWKRKPLVEWARGGGR